MKKQTLLSINISCKSALHRFADPIALYNGLEKQDASAIKFLQSKILIFLENRRGWAKFTHSDIEELANDAILITLQKIQQGKFKFQGHSPVTYTKVIAENLLKNFARKKYLPTVQIETTPIAIDAEVETYLINKEIELEIGKALNRLNENARQLIKLKYYDGLSDAEIIEKKLTIYTTVDSLKNRRCRCMKKLAGFESLKRCAML